MGQVYLARHRWLNVPVAIKILNPLHGSDPEAIERFKRESQMAAHLNHPNIVRATDGGAIEDSFFLVTEYLDGIDLAKLVEKKGALPPSFACWLICEVAKALEHAHAQNLIHRDIKPSNIMLLRDGSVKLLDLGLARYANSQTNMTATGQFMGTIDYVSPEQAADTRQVDHRADLYSLGCTLYFLLTGNAPFEGDGFDTIVSKILAHAEEEPMPIEFYRQDVPSPIKQCMAAMMAKHPDDRLQSASAVQNLLAPHAVALSNLPDQPIKSGESITPAHAQNNDWLETFSNKALCIGWLVLRTLLSITGILDRTEIKTNSRINGKPQYRWSVSPKGLATWAVISVVAWFIFSSIEFVEVRP